ncbi:unnamed protein product [Symbiodinium sp. KB8]|nr:unnamed protein product [Symbiodinium sp. KB8]
MGTRTSETLAGPEPALLHMGSVVAVAKPAGWEVWGGHHPRQLWQHLQAVEGLRHGILRDAEHGHGFVHRLDVPGSGLVLFACGYEAYYDLKLQLALGQLERRYTVSLGSRKQKLQLLPATFFAAKMRCRLLRKMFTGSFFRGFDQFWQRLQFRYDHERFRQALSGSGT